MNIAELTAKLWALERRKLNPGLHPLDPTLADANSWAEGQCKASTSRDCGKLEDRARGVAIKVSEMRTSQLRSENHALIC
jgi:hypothetical protein